MKGKQLLALFIMSSLLIATTTALLWHFCMIVKYGEFFIQEPNPYILWGEIGLLSLILGAAITMYFVSIKWRRELSREGGS